MRRFKKEVKPTARQAAADIPTCGNRCSARKTGDALRNSHPFRSPNTPDCHSRRTHSRAGESAHPADTPQQILLSKSQNIRFTHHKATEPNRPRHACLAVRCQGSSENDSMLTACLSAVCQRCQCSSEDETAFEDYGIVC